MNNEKLTMEINKKQITKIHWLKNTLNLSDEEYGAALESYGVATSKDLTYEQAADLIKKLVRLLPKELRENSSQRRKDAKQKYDELGIRWNEKLREHFATPKQLRMLEAMWMISNRVEHKNEEAFKKFVKRISGKEKLEWLMMSDVRKIKKAIESL
ncbi:regulatory protein GemA [Ignavibacterium album]|uniref:regulatory protein GemA n=1 Tax=Ignavibacterium album TaxID=591197 RepID=UPI0026F0F841|nr:regulatory protein GemA [Ignavibacterium album]